jgi:small subunit ribosomal protein S1
MSQQPTPGDSHSDEQLQREITAALDGQDLEKLMAEAQTPPEPPAASASNEPTPRPTRDRDAIVADLVRGRITAVETEDVFVEIAGMSGKNQGVVPLAQFERSPRIGAIMDFVVQRFNEAEGLVMLSREGAVGRAAWEDIQRGRAVEARVVGTNKGGLDLEISGSIKAFMPASQVDLHHVDDLEALVGQKLEATVEEVDRRGRRVVLSRRHLLQQRREVAAEKLWQQIEVGQEREGVVTKLMDFGAFVDVGGTEGLLHVSDMAYSRVEKPGDIVREGQKITVRVLKLDPERRRISLGLKQMQANPWEAVEQKYAPGAAVTVKVVRIAPFGAFVEIEPGLEALAPVSELSWGRVNHPSNVVHEGDVVRAVVMQVDAAHQRMSVSLRQAGDDPWMGAAHKYAPGAEIEGKVTSTTDFGAFVQLAPGVEGLVHISELAEHRVNTVTDVVKVGDEKTFRVLSVDEDERKLSLSLKPAGSAPPPREHSHDRPRARGKGHAHAGPIEYTAKAKPKPGKPLKGGIE